jgi:hypothetical protein
MMRNTHCAECTCASASVESCARSCSDSSARDTRSVSLVLVTANNARTYTPHITSPCGAHHKSRTSARSGSNTAAHSVASAVRALLFAFSVVDTTSVAAAAAAAGVSAGVDMLLDESESELVDVERSVRGATR